MKKDTYKRSQKGAVLFLISLFFIYNSSHSQVIVPPGTHLLDEHYVRCESDMTIKNLFELFEGAINTNGVWTGPTPLSGGHLGTFDPAVNTDGIYIYTTKGIVEPFADEIATVAVTAIYTPPPTTTEDTQTFCKDDNKMIEDLSVNETSTIEWYANENDTTPIPSGTLLVDGIYWGAQIDGTSGCESKNRLKITVILELPTDSGTDGDYTVCEVDAVITDLYTLLGGSPGITGTWSSPDANPLTGGHLGTFDPAVNTDGIYTYTSTNTCESTAANVTVTITSISAPTTTEGTQTFCKIDDKTIEDLSVNETSTIQWYANENDTTPIPSGTLLVDGIYWGAQIDGTSNCESKDKLQITVILDLPADSGTDGSYTGCNEMTTISLFDYLGGTPDINGTWVSPDGNPLGGGHLGTFDSAVDTNGAYTYTASICTKLTAIVTVTIIHIPPPTITTDGNEFCITDKPTLSELDNNVSPVDGGVITWYDAFPNGNQLFLSDLLIHDTTYYAIEKSGVSNCYSDKPLAVTVTLDACAKDPIKIYDGFSPNGDGRNDTFIIDYLRDLYPNHSVEFFNRWGASVYTTNVHKPDWDGRLNGNGELVPAGVYYVVVNFNRSNRKPIQKRLYLSR